MRAPFVLFLLCPLLQSSNGAIDCNDIIENDETFTGICDNKWHNLKPLIRPTQPQVGYAWIAYKLNKDFLSSEDAQNELEASKIPAVLGPDSKIYIVDDHHTLSALDYSGYDETKVTINVLCDKRKLSEGEFWASLSNQNLAYLVSHPKSFPDQLPEAIDYHEMPATFSFTDENFSMSDDPWRSMAGYARKVTQAADPAPECNVDDGDDKYCERCMYRGCVDGYQTTGGGVSFFEFRWSYFMNDATFYNTDYWPTTQDYQNFLQLYSALPSAEAVSINKINTSDWFEAANYVINLCRSEATGSYALPDSLFPSIDSVDWDVINESRESAVGRKSIHSTAAGEDRQEFLVKSNRASLSQSSLNIDKSAGNYGLPGYVQDYLKLNEDPSCDAPICT